jgi:hypothetical protein
MNIETPLTGTVMKRCKRILIENPLSGIPSLSAIEELVIKDDTSKVLFTSQSGLVADSFSDPAVTFDLLNPADDSVLATKTYQDLYVMLYSIYRHLSNAANP